MESNPTSCLADNTVDWNNIVHLPHEILAEIFSFLHSQFNLMITSRVCKTFLTATSLLKMQVKIADNSERFVNFVANNCQQDRTNICSLSIPKCKALNQQIEELCHCLRNNLEHLVLRDNSFNSDGLQHVIDHLPKLKSLDIRQVKEIDDRGFHALMNSKQKLPNLIKLKVHAFFNNAKEVEEGRLSIKKQLLSLTLDGYSDVYGTKQSLNHLFYPNLEELKLISLSFNASILPLSLKHLSLDACQCDTNDIGEIVENLESLEFKHSLCSIFKYNLQNLKSLTMQDISNTIWESFYNMKDWKPLNLKSLDISYTTRGWSMIETLCNLKELTHLNISHCEISTKDLKKLMGEDDKSEWTHLTHLNASGNSFDGELLNLLERMPSLQLLNVSEGSMGDADRGMLCAFDSKRPNFELDCTSTITSLYFQQNEEEESYGIFVDNLLQNEKSESSSNQQPQQGTNVPLVMKSFDFDKNVKIMVRGINGIVNRHTGYKLQKNLSFSVQCALTASNGKVLEIKSTTIIDHSGTNSMEWNEEITFDSLISQLSCDHLIEFTLQCHELNRTTGIVRRMNILQVSSPIFNSAMELHQGNMKFYLQEHVQESWRADASLNVEFETFDQTIVKYDIEKTPPLKFKTLFEECEETTQQLDWKYRDLNLKDSEKFVNFLKSIPVELPWAIYIAKECVRKWKKPESILEIVVLLTECKSMFIKSIIIEELEKVNDELLIDLIPYLTSCLKYDLENGLLSLYLQKRALKSIEIGNHFFWLLKSESHHYPICRDILRNYIALISPKQLESIRKECSLLDSLENFHQRKTPIDLKFTAVVPFTLQDVIGVKSTLNTDKSSFFNIFRRDITKSSSSTTTSSNGITKTELLLRDLDSVKLNYCNDSKKRYSFIVNNFMNLVSRMLLKECGGGGSGGSSSFYSPVIGHYPIGASTFLTLTPSHFSKMSSIYLPVNQSQSFRDNFLLTAAFDSLMSHLFKSDNPSEMFISEKDGQFSRFCFTQKRMMGRRVLGLVIIAKRIIFPELAEYLKKNNLLPSFKAMVVKMAKQLREKLWWINLYLKPFISPIHEDFKVVLNDLNRSLKRSALEGEFRFFTPDEPLN